jgi:ATP-dependent RNA helicase DeaD
MTASDQPSTAASQPPSFADLGLSERVLAALADVGYESPTPIQLAAIPLLLEGRDLIGQAQTGTGKTAAFALPILSRLDLSQRSPQVLVLVPTRELAIQVAEAFHTYAAKLPGFKVVPIYGGQGYGTQLGALRRGVHVVVGTPGRIMDHLERGTLVLDDIRFAVLDEGDEMLQMGFVDAIDAILGVTPFEKQVALFSATMPAPIKRIAQKHLRDPREVTVKSKTTTAAGIRQRYWLVSGLHKLDALTRILEVETFDGMLVFANTKQMTVDLAEHLSARGFSAVALNGDIDQAQRERTVAALKAGKFDILVATDVAARGLDLDRISHVVNYDVPHDPESYVHRIGRTGRAGRSGEAIVFIAPRERQMLRAIERTTRQPIEPMELPTIHDLNAKRIEKLKGRIAAAIGGDAATSYRGVVADLARESGADPLDIAAALVTLVPGQAPLLEAPKAAPAAAPPDRPPRPVARSPYAPPPERRPPVDEARPARAPRPEPAFEGARKRPAPPSRGERPERGAARSDQVTYRIAVGSSHKVLPGNIVGAIANEASLDGSDINGIDIRPDHTFVRLPAGLSGDVLERLRRARIKGRPLRIMAVDEIPRPTDRDDFRSGPRSGPPRRGAPIRPGGKPPFKRR